MADEIRATPRNSLAALLSDAINNSVGYMKSPQRTQQLQGLGRLIESTGIPYTAESLSYDPSGRGLFTGAGGLGGTTRMRPEALEAAMTVAPFVGPANRGLMQATKGLPVGASIKPINLNKALYKPDLTMEEMLKVRDIPTVDRVRQSIDLVGEKEFEKMVNAQYLKYKPTSSEQEAMLVESVTLDILGRAQRSPYPQQAALETAQRNAALPVEQGGLGLPFNNTPEMRAKAMGFDTPSYHGSGEELIAINNEKLKRNAYGKGLHSASDPELANIFANHSVEGQNITPLQLRLGNQASGQDYRNAKNQIYDEGGHDATKIRQLLLDKGFDTVSYNHGDFYYPRNEKLIQSVPNQDLSYASLIPENIRSRFAAFDPMRRSAAIAAAMGLAAPDLLANQVPMNPMYRDPFPDTTR